jgi:AAA+ ATPase superfamily predicted ATPase
MSRFIGRERELSALQEMWERRGAQFLVTYGRRRTGKTALMLRFAQDRPHVYWPASQSSAVYLLRSFSQALWNYANPTNPAAPDFGFAHWEQALRFAGELAADQRLLLIIDEFPYAARADPSLPSILQNVWDHRLKETALFLALTGSHIGMMENTLLSYRAPLYGRATGVLPVKPMPLSQARQFLPAYSTAQAIETYAILGGIPAYLEQFDDSRSLEWNIRHRLLNVASFFLIDPLYLLNEALHEPRNYHGICAAIGLGARRPSEIAAAAGLERTNLPKYLNTLQALGFLERRVPVSGRESDGHERGIYVIADRYLRFYFRFVQPCLADLERGNLDLVVGRIAGQLAAFVGGMVFEELCQEWVLSQGLRGDLPFRPARVGAYWDDKVEIDVAAASSAERAILLGEAKYVNSPVGEDVLEGLQAKAPALNLPAGWRVHYALFAKSGFTAALQTRAGRERVILADLEQIANP